MWLFTQALDLATIRNESRNISSYVFSMLLWWAIREQGRGGRMLGRQRAVFRSTCSDCSLGFLKSDVIYVGLTALSAISFVLCLHWSFH